MSPGTNSVTRCSALRQALPSRCAVGAEPVRSRAESGVRRDFACGQRTAAHCLLPLAHLPGDVTIPCGCKTLARTLRLRHVPQMDAERLERDGPERGLLEEGELPAFVLEAATPGGGPSAGSAGDASEEEEEEAEGPRGRRRRSRTAASYSEARAPSSSRRILRRTE